VLDLGRHARAQPGPADAVKRRAGTRLPSRCQRASLGREFPYATRWRCGRHRSMICSRLAIRLGSTERPCAGSISTPGWATSRRSRDMEVPRPGQKPRPLRESTPAEVKGSHRRVGGPTDSAAPQTLGTRLHEPVDNGRGPGPDCAACPFILSQIRRVGPGLRKKTSTAAGFQGSFTRLGAYLVNERRA
jgi:hypothetical protein